MAGLLDAWWRQNAGLVELPGGLIRMMKVIFSIVAGTRCNVYLSLAGRRNMAFGWNWINIEVPTLPWVSYARG